MADPFTIRIFVPDGDPESLMVIERMNWTGVGLVFPRSKWAEIKQRSEFIQAGVYVLKGYKNENDELPTIYVGQADGVGNRIDSHYKNKDFWDRGVVFVSASDGLNRAHITWLEYALLNRAERASRCHLDNGNVPQEPMLTESEKADTKGFLKEILQISPLVGLQLFESKPVAAPKVTTKDAPSKSPSHKPDTVIVPAREEGFKKTFLGEDSWYAIRISGGRLGNIKYIAAYQSSPISAITHYAPVDRIEPYGESSRYRVFFSEKAQKIEPIPFGDAPPGSMQGPRYTTFEKLKTAKKLSDVFLKEVN